MVSIVHVTKRDGSREPLDLNKFHRVVEFACAGISGVSASEVELKSRIQFYDGVKTGDVQETLIRAAADLITEETPNYQWVAGRLISYHIRKQVWGSTTPPDFRAHVESVTAAGFYDREWTEAYSEDEYSILGAAIDHDRDDLLTHASIDLMRTKYLVRDRSRGILYETPQLAFMAISMTLFSREPAKTRLDTVIDFYNALSRHEVSLPTPIMAGLRTPQRQFSSCVLIDSGDDLDSMNASASSIVKYVSQKAGIGLNVGRIRALGSRIRNGDAVHTGIIPFLKYFSAAVKSCSQGGVRSGAATFNFPIWHLEVEDMIVLKNNKGVEENRVRHVDYCVQFNRVMYERLLEGGSITLFSPSDVPGLYDAFFKDVERFRELYERYEADPTIRKKVLPAIDLFTAFMQERKDTGRIYFSNVDNVNEQGAFDPEVAPICMTNLCVEVALHTKPLEHVFCEKGEIALCTLAAVNWGKVRTPADFERPCRLLVRALDALLDYQDYPVLAAKRSTMNRRPLGIGIINLAYWLAKNGTSYSNPNLELLDEWAEAWSYYLIRASVDLAMERGPCWLWRDTKYGKGVLPIDSRCRPVDELVPHEERLDWEGLRRDLRAHGIRNSTLMALMPAETSAIVSNSTNGIEPPRALVTVKQSTDRVSSQVVPEIRKLKNKYDLLWDQKSPIGYLKVCAILQKYVDQAISVNFSYNPRHYEDGVPMSELLRHMIWFYRYGGKNGYYMNTNDGAGEIELPVEEPPPLEGSPADCDSCVL